MVENSSSGKSGRKYTQRTGASTWKPLRPSTYIQVGSVLFIFSSSSLVSFYNLLFVNYYLRKMFYFNGDVITAGTGTGTGWAMCPCVPALLDPVVRNAIWLLCSCNISELYYFTPSLNAIHPSIHSLGPCNGGGYWCVQVALDLHQHTNMFI